MVDEESAKVLKILGQNVKKYMEMTGISFEELSEKTGIRKQYLKKITEGNCPGIMTGQVFIIAQALKIPPHKLVKGC